jgi:hypothetical protein
MSPDGMIVEVMIGPPGSTVASLMAARQPVPRPVLLRGELDTGTNITGVDVGVLQQLGLPPGLATTTTTVAGPLPVNLYRVSLSLPCGGRLLLISDGARNEFTLGD